MVRTRTGYEFGGGDSLMLQQTLKARTTMVMRVGGDTNAAAPGFRLGVILFAGVAALAGMLALAAVAVRQSNVGSADAEETAPAPRRVNATRPERPAEGQFSLPATLQPYQAAD